MEFWLFQLAHQLLCPSPESAQQLLLLCVCVCVCVCVCDDVWERKQHGKEELEIFQICINLLILKL